MAKPTALNRDTRPQEQPEGTYPFGKNGIQNELNQAVINEPGFQKMAAVIPYRYCGVIETDTKPVIFSTDNTNSAIGFFNPDTQLYEPIVDDNPSQRKNWPSDGSRIGFNLESYITGQAQRNYKAELVIAFTDKSLYPMYLNCDNPVINSANDLRLFPYFNPPVISPKQDSGGQLDAGAYYVTIGYEKNDGTSTPYSPLSPVVIITPGAIQGTTDKAISILLTNVDTNYDFVRVAVVSKKAGVITAVELADNVPITSSTLNLSYTGIESTVDVTLEEILIPPARYDRVGCIGQLNDALYIGDLHAEADLNDMQPYALSTKIEWVSSLISAITPPEDHKTGITRSMMHQEVYAVYIRYKLTRGGFTKWFITAGNVPLSADLATSTEATAGGETVATAKYKVEDTIPYFDAAAKTGGCGIWQNTTELYPDTADFDASAIGGPNLRNQKVLHHRMPSLRWCKAHLYTAEAEYGRTKLDMLGIRAVNVRIPAKYQGVISGYEIGYAKRSIGNMTVYGQSIMMHTMTNSFEVGQPSDVALLYTTGGNWRANIYHKADHNFDNNWELQFPRLDTMRFHAFDLLFNKPSITPNFISAQLKLSKNDMWTTGAYLEDGDGADKNDDSAEPQVFLVDYTTGSTPAQIGIGKQLRKIKNSLYLTGGADALNFINMHHEDCYAATLAGTDWQLNTSNSGLRVRGQGYTERGLGCPQFEEGYLVNLLAVKDDLYNTFYSQPLVSAGSAKLLADTTPFWCGDTFICDYTFHTYGRHETNDGWGAGKQGKKAIRRFICESASNIHQRYEIAGNVYSKWYPHNPVSAGGNPNVIGNPQLCYITNFDRSFDPNQFGYTKDFNALNDLISSEIYSPFREYITDFPYRIHRGGKLPKTSKPRSWRTFLPLDYYEMQKNMGKMKNLVGQDDRLIIHMENCLFQTQDKAKFTTDIIDVTLGTGEIFQFEPQPADGAKLGYGGTQHDLACVQTPAGYVFVDAQLGEIYLFKGQLMNLNPGLNAFLREYLKQSAVNVYLGNGITIGYDQKYKRLLLSVKNKQMPVYKVFQDTTDFWNNLVVGDIILYKGRFLQYGGLNDTSFDCPADPVIHVITWQAASPGCMLNGSGQNTGFIVYATRQRLTDGTLDGYSEANSVAGGLGPYFPPVKDTDTCPPPAATVTWKGADPVCQKGELTTAATVTNAGYCVAPSPLNVYGDFFTRIYKPGFSNTSIALITAPSSDVEAEMTTAVQWKNAAGNTTHGPCNRSGVWIDSDCNGTKDALTTGVQVTIPFAYNNGGPARTVYVGVMGDNEFTLKVNGATIAQTDGTRSLQNFHIFHIFPVTLLAGQTNYFNVVGVGDGSVNDSIGMIVYDNTAAQLEAATNDASLTILFNSISLVGTGIDVATCPTGYNLDNTGGIYICKKPGDNDGTVIYNTRCRLLNGVPDGFCEPNAADGNYVNSVVNTGICPLPVVDGLRCGSNVSESYNGSDFHAYDEQTILTADITADISVNWQVLDRPNRISIKRDGTQIMTTGWKGTAAYTGPWGTSLSQATSGTLTFTPDAGHIYTIVVEAGPADTANPSTDSYAYSITC
jgi:hypothetical protein